MKGFLKRIFTASERRWYLPLISFIYVVLLPVVTTATVVINRNMNVYSSNSDTIIIPILNSVSIALIFFIYLLIMNVLVLAGFRYEPFILNVRSKLWIAVSIVLSLPGILFCILMIFYWFSIRHLPIIVIYLFGLYVITMLFLRIASKEGLIRKY